MSLDVWACLGGGGDPRTPYWVSEGKQLEQPTMSNHPPSRHHLYINYLIKGLHYFYRVVMLLKWPLVKSYVKQ